MNAKFIKKLLFRYYYIWKVPLAICQILSYIRIFIEIKKLHYIIGLKIMSRCFKHLYAKKSKQTQNFLISLFNFRKIRVNAKITITLQLKTLNCIYIVSCHLRKKMQSIPWRKLGENSCHRYVRQKTNGVGYHLLFSFTLLCVMSQR